MNTTRRPLSPTWQTAVDAVLAASPWAQPDDPDDPARSFAARDPEPVGYRVEVGAAGVLVAEYDDKRALGLVETTAKNLLDRRADDVAADLLDVDEDAVLYSVPAWTPVTDVYVSVAGPNGREVARF